jgi:DNA gyrase/topoisomerase IV subunit B
MAEQKKYSAENIKVLEGLEGVRMFLLLFNS